MQSASKLRAKNPTRHQNRKSLLLDRVEFSRMQKIDCSPIKYAGLRELVERIAMNEKMLVLGC